MTKSRIITSLFLKKTKTITTTDLPKRYTDRTQNFNHEEISPIFCGNVQETYKKIENAKMINEGR